MLTASIREIRQKKFILTVFFEPVVKHNKNELQYGKSKLMIISREIGKETLILAVFGALSPSYA